MTDDEYATVTISGTYYDSETYANLLAILESRDSVSSTRDRLRYFFLAKGIPVGEVPANTSNIFIGGVLE